MSISEGDTVILPHGVLGYLHKTRFGTLRVEGEGGAVWDGYDKDDLICADDPLRVRVDSEQEARELVEMAEDYEWDISTNFHHWELSQINCVSLENGHVNTYCTNRDTACRHGVHFSDRRAQIEAYIEYHSEEKTMSDKQSTMSDSDDRQREDEDELTHGSSNDTRHCDYCGEWFDPDEWDNECPARQPAEDDDGGDECELSDGVCEWTYDETHNKYYTECGWAHEFIQGDVGENNFTGCPYCMKPIEITTDEGGFEVGELYRLHKGGSDYGLVLSTAERENYVGTVFRTENDIIQANYPENFEPEKLGEWKPDDDALERVNPECNGSLFITDDKVLFDPLCRTKDIEFSGSELLFTDEGRGYKVQGAEATGIVLESFHQISEVSDVSTLHMDA